MADMKPDFPARFRINLTRTFTAHLASEAVAVKHLSAKFRGNRAGETDGGFVRRRFHQDVLPRL